MLNIIYSILHVLYYDNIMIKNFGFNYIFLEKHILKENLVRKQMIVMTGQLELQFSGTILT